MLTHEFELEFAHANEFVNTYNGDGVKIVVSFSKTNLPDKEDFMPSQYATERNKGENRPYLPRPIAVWTSIYSDRRGMVKKQQNTISHETSSMARTRRMS
ncbi:MAG: hypothetical protein WBE68_21395 [Candidatus Nitrosopolaris sp.]